MIKDFYIFLTHKLIDLKERQSKHLAENGIYSKQTLFYKVLELKVCIVNILIK